MFYASYTTILIIQGRFTILFSFWFTVNKTRQRPETLTMIFQISFYSASTLVIVAILPAQVDYLGNGI